MAKKLMVKNSWRLDATEILTFTTPGFETPEAKVQGLAVETLLCLDRHVASAVAGDFPRSIHFLSAAYRRLIEATLEAERIVFSASGNARKAANARHAENRAMKEQVSEWYRQHRGEYPSMDAAAAALAGKLVPVTFRTVREWIGQVNKHLRPARRP